MMTTLKTLAKIAKQNSTPLLGKANDLASISFMSGYLSAYPIIDRNTQVTRGMFAPMWNRDEEDSDADVLSQFQDDAYGVLVKNENEYSRLWDALVEAEYNPIENYDKHEYWNDVESGNNTTTDDLGKKKNTFTHGAHTDQEIYGAHTDEDVYGAHTDQDVYGQAVETSENEQRAIGTVGYVDGPQKNTVTKEQHTDQHINPTYTDQHVNATHTDQHINATYDDVSEDDAVKNTSKIDFGHENEHEGRIHGNVGVTTNQQMLNSEVELRLATKFYDMLITDIISELCVLENNGFDVMR